MKIGICLVNILFCFICCAHAQQSDSLINKITQFPNKLFDKIKNKTSGLDAMLTKKTEKYLERMARKEKKLQEKLYKTDSLAAKNVFAGSQEKYQYYINQIKKVNSKAKSLTGPYFPHVDSLKGTLSFLEQNKKLLGSVPELQSKLAGSVQGFNQLQSKLEVSERIREFITLRKQQLRQSFSGYANVLGAKKYLDDYNKEVYYYTAQVKEYKDVLNDPDKLQKKALDLLNKLPAFQQFMKQHSMLSILFKMPANNAMGPQTLAQGMSTRDQVMASIQGQAGTAGPNMTSMLQQHVQSAQGQLDQWRNKLNDLGKGGGDLDMPDFKPNHQKSKSFLDRLEYGTNLQTAHGSYYFPTTTDIGLTLGYKLNDNNSIGIGASYKVGWGNDIKHINISSQGAGLRSYLDMKLKKTFFASGGFEYNYQQPFYSLNTVGNLSNWQRSGLIGISKIVSLKTKMLKKSKIQLLWDFLSYQQIPRTQPFKFRVGYSF